MSFLMEELMHSKGKLALAVFTSPGAAFEEILERRLLGPALWIAAITGLLAAVAVIGRTTAFGPLQIYMLGKENPLSWFGLFLLYGLALQLLLKWVGTETDYGKILIVLGWSQMALLVGQVAAAASGIVAMADNPNMSAIQILEAARMGFMAWYVVIVGIGLQKALDIPLGRAVMSYIVVETAALIAFSMTYGTSRLGPFQGSSYGIQQTAKEIVAVDVTPWVVAAVAGLILGLWKLGVSLGWEKSLRMRVVASAAIVGVFVLGFYVNAVMSADNYSKLMKTDRLMMEAEDSYSKNPAAGRKAYTESAERMEQLLTVSKNNVMLILDIADAYYLADEPEQSIKYYQKFQTEAQKANLQQAEGANEDSAAARAHSGIGAVYYQQGDYNRAIAEYDKAIKAWPKFRDPWIRKALAYNRMGNHSEAIKAGKHAANDLESESGVAWAALAQAYVQIGDEKQAKDAVEKATEKDKALAKKIGSRNEDWKNAVEKLTAYDLRYPLEDSPAPAPKQASDKPEKKKEVDKK